MSPIAGLTGLGGSSQFSLFDPTLNLGSYVIRFDAMEFYVYTGVPSTNSIQYLRVYGANTNATQIYAGSPIDMSTATLLHQDNYQPTTLYEPFDNSYKYVKLNFYVRQNIISTQSASITWDHQNRRSLVFNICKGANENGRSSSLSYGKIKHRNISYRAIGAQSNTTGSDGCSLTPYYADDSYAIRLRGKVYLPGGFTYSGINCYSDLGIDGDLYVTGNNKYAFVNTYALTNISQQLYTYMEIINGFKFGNPPSPDYTIQ